jgi:hypothetical protein
MSHGARSGSGRSPVGCTAWVIHLDELPPVGVICFQQPSGLPSYDGVGPASVKTQDADPDAMLGDLDVVDVMGPQRWTLRSQSLEILPTGTWRVMATLTARGTAGLVEPRFEVDPKSSRDVLVLRGRECWIKGPSASASEPGSSAPGSNWNWLCTPDE